MKGKKIITLLLVTVLLFSAASLIVACSKHECQHVCPTCGKCTDKDCTDPVCADKCQGHEPAPTPHECQHVCPTCGKCTDSTCTDPVCADKCQGHDVDPSKEGVFTPITEPVAGKYYMGMKCSGDVYYYLKGGMADYYMATSNNQEDAVVVTLIEDGDGWLLKQGEKYMEIELSGTHVNAVYKDAQTAGKHWSWDETYKIFTWEDGTYFYGTYGTFNTIGGGNYAQHAADNYKAQLGTFEQPEPPAEAESVTLDKTDTIRLLPTNTYKLTATVLPAEASQDVDWSTSDAEKVTVTNGLVRAVAQGTAIITAKAKGTNVSATITVEVLDNTQKGYTQSNPFSVDEAIALMDQAGDGVEVCADDSGARYFVTGVVNNGSTISTSKLWSFTMSGSNNKQISFTTTSSESALEKEFADMKNGMLDGCTVVVQATFKLDGETYKVVYSASNSRFVSIVSCIYPALTDIIISEATDGVTIKENETVQLHVTPVPASASLEGLEWISSADDKASVDEKGIVTGVAVGTANITAKVGEVISSTACTVTVTEPQVGGNKIVYDWVDTIGEYQADSTYQYDANGDIFTAFSSWSPDLSEIVAFTVSNMMKASQDTTPGIAYDDIVGTDGSIVITTQHAIKKITLKLVPFSTAHLVKLSVNGKEINETPDNWTEMTSSAFERTIEFDTASNTINISVPNEEYNQFAIVGMTLEW